MPETTDLMRITVEPIDKRSITLDGKPFPAAIVDFSNGFTEIRTGQYSTLCVHSIEELTSLREIVDAAITICQQRQAAIDAQPAPVIDQNGDDAEGGG